VSFVNLALPWRGEDALPASALDLGDHEAGTAAIKREVAVLEERRKAAQAAAKETVASSGRRMESARSHIKSTQARLNRTPSFGKPS
jgi:hypothetical protein